MARVDPVEIDFLVARDGTVEAVREEPEAIPGGPAGQVPLTPRPDAAVAETPEDLGKDWPDRSTQAVPA
ncbi:hypothetical protein [Phreatobacter sp.]|uniref:hypothetical protein n=1 Tax=Phreatobacter sp. TaxID=1966341 RepID=UPI0022CBB9C7|nr:hypothetical protein [Phreatobacter sp.]MCZ8315024.1 hypothetical protein [Phreatobacter sp.]